MITRFRGNEMEIVPNGMSHLQLHASKEHYTWCKVRPDILHLRPFCFRHIVLSAILVIMPTPIDIFIHAYT